MIASLIEMLELADFAHMDTSTIYFESRNETLLGRLDRNYYVITFISKYHHSKTPGVAKFADIIKIRTIFIKKSLKI